MLEMEFRAFWENEGKGEKAVNSRISRLNKVEDLLGKSADIAVSNDENMLSALRSIEPEDFKNRNLANALRKYY